MNILFIGDIFARPGRRGLESVIGEIKKRYSVDFTAANGENAAGGFGITKAIASELFDMGIDVLTSGNHIWNNGEIAQYLDSTNKLLRPLNYPPTNPGRGFSTVTASNGVKVSVINLLGRVFMGELDCPFRGIDAVLELIKDVKVIIVDMHAEATSEKRAIGSYLDGRVSAVLGTHTHVQTADEQILPKGTAYITDVGMTGAHDSVIGVKKEIIIHKFLHQRSSRFEPAKDGIRLNAVLVDVDENSGRARKILRLNEQLSCD